MKVLYFDTETTGLDPVRHGIVQLAGIIEVENRIVRQFDLHIRPFEQDEIDPQALAVHGYNLPSLRQFIDPRVAHNIFVGMLSEYIDKYDKSDKFYPCAFRADFDYGFLQRWFRKCGDEYFGSFFNHRLLDPLPVLRMLDYWGILNLKNYKLKTVCEHFSIPIDAHDARSDTHALRSLIYKLRGLIVEKSYVPQLDQRYEFIDGKLVFDDGTEYSLQEALLLSAGQHGLTADDIRAIHLVKKYLGSLIGATIDGKEYELTEKRDPLPYSEEIRHGEHLYKPDTLDTMIDSEKLPFL